MPPDEGQSYGASVAESVRPGPRHVPTRRVQGPRRTDHTKTDRDEGDDNDDEEFDIAD